MDQPKQHLRVIAQDSKDLQVLSAHARDAVVSLSSVSFSKENQTFFLLLNRFCWEHEPFSIDGQDYHYRIHSGLCFKHVEKVYFRGFERHESNLPLRTLNLLSIDNPQEDTLRIIFSGLAELAIVIHKFHCLLGDHGEHWHTIHKPTHLYEHVPESKEWEN